MRLPKLLNADFEQSLNLLDDGLVDSYKEWWDEQEPSRFGVIGNIIGLMIMFLPFGVLSVLSWAIFYYVGDHSRQINFFPFWLAWVIMAVFLLLAFVPVYARGRNWKEMKYYNSQILLFWYYLACVLALDLCGATILLPVVTIYGIVIYFVVIAGSLIIILRKKAKKMIITLYDLEEKISHRNEWLNKVLNFKVIMSLGSVAIVGYYIFKNIFWSSGPDVSAPLVIGACIAINIVVLSMAVYLFFPSIIEGYYRNKYAEEYRDWEGQTQIEWYGEKYFNKYIKGTEKEKKE